MTCRCFPLFRLRLSLALSLALFLLVQASPAFALEFEGLGNLPGETASTAYGVSADGSIVVGQSGSSGFLWNESTGTMIDLGMPAGGTFSLAFAVSGDGSTVVGNANPAALTQPFRWTAATGLVGLGLLPGSFFGYAQGVNYDGSVVVGFSLGLTSEAFVWTEATNTMTALVPLNPGTDAIAWGVSGDGSVIVGEADERAVIWSGPSYSTIESLGLLPGAIGPQDSAALAISRDGTVVVGESSDDTGAQQAIRWTRSGGMQGLGLLAGSANTRAVAVSANGAVVVGNATGGADQAFRWSQETGLISLADYLQSTGVDLTGWSLTKAWDVSADGATIVGMGNNPIGNDEAYIARAGGLTTMQALGQSLSAIAPMGSEVASMGQVMTDWLLDAAHTAVMNTESGLSSGDPVAGRKQFWIVGTLLSDYSFSGDDRGGEGGVGLTWYLEDGLSVGTGAFAGMRTLKSEYDGKQTVKAIGPAVLVAYVPASSGLRVEAGAMWNYLDLDLVRGYLNGGSSATSEGSTSGNMLSLTGRVGWAYPIAESVSLEPFAQYTWRYVNLDGYTESGGPFPATFSSRNESMNIVRLGLESRYAYSSNIDLWGWGAWNHRFESEGSAFSGSLIGLGSFNFAGAAVDQDWGDAGVGAKWRPWDGFETFSRLAFGIGSDDHAVPDLTMTVGLGWDI